MFDFLSAFVAPIAEAFASLYRGDGRPETRRLTLGCAAVALLLIATFVLWVSWQRGFR